MQEIYYIKSVDNTRWAPAANPREPWRYGTGILLGAALLAVGLFSASGRLENREYGYRLERLEREKQQLLVANRKLRLEEASLGDPLRIDWIARNQLGMTTLAPHQIFRGEDASATSLVAAADTDPASSRSLPPATRGVAAALP
ncbi:MAG TPA: cell division protein FtsL [Terriglobia bacterium]|jgi:cell division protein FtsL